jgi:ribosome biogenesis GTPase / thiamine phosphate phosphatase
LQQRQIISCHLRANLDTVVTGDVVVWQQGEHHGVVLAIEERSAVLQRPDSYGELRPVAANISQLVVVIAPEPEAWHGLIDRYLVAAENLGVRALLVINKSDLVEREKHANLMMIADAYHHLGYTLLFVCAHSGAGFEKLQQELCEHTSIFVGQSGVGKSSLIQRMLPQENIRIASLSQAEIKGRHTTTHSQLYRFSSGGVCIDSPGIREFGLWHLSAAEILNGFVDLREHALRCKFRNCEHNAEPQCGIKNALEKGELYKWRFDSYKHILHSLRDVTIKKG